MTGGASSPQPSASVALTQCNSALPRASRVLQGLVTEAESRGYEVTIPKGHRNRNNNKREWSSTVDGHLAISAEGHTVALRSHEEGLSVRAIYQHPPPTAGDPWGTRATGTYRSVRDDKEATGRLTIAIVPEQYRTKRPATWSDRKRWTLEDKLPDVLAEIAVRAAEAEHKRQEAERQAASRQIAWEAAMVEARKRHHGAQRAAALDDQMARWREATDIRTYCAAMAAAHPDQDETADWIAWASACADRLDPLRAPPVSPPRLHEVPAEELRTHLHGLSPYGPEAGY